MTHTFTLLEVSKDSYDEIAGKLRDAAYQQAFVDRAIDMHGIGLTRATDGTEIGRDFLERSAKACIRALRNLETTAIMLETYAPELYPEINEKGQKHFGRVMMESAAEEIREAWKQAIAAVEPSGDAGRGGKLASPKACASASTRKRKTARHSFTRLSTLRSSR